MNNHRRLIIFTLLSLRTDSANDRNQCGCEGDPDGRAGQTEKFPVVMKGLKTAGPAIRCLGQREKGKPVEVEEAVAGTERWKRSAGGWTIGVGVRRRGGVGEADEEAGEARSRARRNEKRSGGGDGDGWYSRKRRQEELRRMLRESRSKVVRGKRDH